MLLIRVINVKLRHCIMHRLGLREANRLSLIPLQMRPKVQILPLDALRRFFADPMSLGRQQLLIRLPLVRAVAQHLAARELSHQSLTGGIGAAARLPGYDLLAGRVKAVPEPPLIRLFANKRPHFVNLQVGDAARWARLTDLGGGLFDGLEHGVNTDAEHPRDVADAGAVECHRHDQVANFRPTALVGVVGQELAEAVVTAVALLVLLASAILFNSQRVAPGTGDRFVLHIQSLP